MNEFINKVLQDREAQLEAKKAEEKSRLDEEAGKLIEEMEMKLPFEFWITVKAKGSKPTAYTESGRLERVEIKLPLIDELELAPISIILGARGLLSFDLGGYQGRFQDLAEALAEARKRYSKIKEESREREIKEILKRLNFNFREVEAAEEAEELFLRLLELDPSEKSRAEVALRGWYLGRDRYLERISEEEAERAEAEELELAQEKLKAEYTEALVDWLRRTEEISRSNRPKAEAIQEKANREKYRAYKLTYAVVAEEEGERYIETRFVWTQNEEPSTSGFWIVNGKAFRPFHLVSLEAFDFDPESGPISKEIRKGDISFSFSPYIQHKAIEFRLKYIQELPEKPEAPAELDYRNEEAALRAAREIVNGQAENY